MKYAIENGMIDMTYIREQIEMNKRKELLEKHPYKIWEGKDGKWYTYLPDEKKKRKLVKRKTEEEIQDAVIGYYKNAEEKPKTFDDAYWHWRSVQDNLVSENTIVRYNTDYKRYFEDTDFLKMVITNITEEVIKVFITQSVKEKKLCKKACKTLFMYVRNTMESARMNKLITDNVMEFLAAKQFYKYCTEKKRSRGKVVVSDTDMDLLYEKFQEDYREQPNYIPTYAVHLASLTGMRVSEVSALTWDCITDSYILIDKSEKYNRPTKEYFIGKTKNGKERIFPVTREIRELLDMVKKVEIQNGYICEWVFANENGRVHAPSISSCIKNKCRQIGIEERGIHALRRTVNSKMRCNGVSATVAASLLGHSEQVNEQYYTFDISTLKQKAEIVSQISPKSASNG